MSNQFERTLVRNYEVPPGNNASLYTAGPLRALHVTNGGPNDLLVTVAERMPGGREAVLGDIYPWRDLSQGCRDQLETDRWEEALKSIPRVAVLGDLYPADSDGYLYWPPEQRCRTAVEGDIYPWVRTWEDVIDQSLFDTMTTGFGFIKAVANGDGVSLFNVSHPRKEPDRTLLEELARVNRAAEPVYKHKTYTTAKAWSEEPITDEEWAEMGERYRRALEKSASGAWLNYLP